jgi:hypothetical protein
MRLWPCDHAFVPWCQTEGSFISYPTIEVGEVSTDSGELGFCARKREGMVVVREWDLRVLLGAERRKRCSHYPWLAVVCLDGCKEGWVFGVVSLFSYLLATLRSFHSFSHFCCICTVTLSISHWFFFYLFIFFFKQWLI